MIAYTRAMNKELNPDGVKSVAFCPGFVDTDMSAFVKEFIPADEMLRTSDIAEALRFMLRLSVNCVDPGDRVRASGREHLGDALGHGERLVGQCIHERAADRTARVLVEQPRGLRLIVQHRAVGDAKPGAGPLGPARACGAIRQR